MKYEWLKIKEARLTDYHLGLKLGNKFFVRINIDAIDDYYETPEKEHYKEVLER